jgi:hypothetical protein
MVRDSAPIGSSPTRVALGPVGDRTGLAPGQTAPTPGPSRLPLDYRFDPLPSAIRGDRRLKPVDHLVLAVLISFAIWRRDSCWATVSTIAARLPAIRPSRGGSPVASDRTVQRSLQRLKAAGYIRHQRVSNPDPDDPRNLTGWRFFFDFVPVQPDAVEPPTEMIADVDPAGFAPLPEPTGVTPESPDSAVTQVRGEINEPEPTLNVANGSALAGTGDGESPEAVDSTADPATLPAIAEPTPPRVTPAPISAPEELSERLVRRFRDRGLNPVVEADAVRGEVIRFYRLWPDAGPPGPAELAELARLRPGVLAFLKGPARPIPSTEAGPCGPADRPAPPVPGPMQARVRSLIGQLAGNVEPTIEATVCRSIAVALGDHKPESLALFLGLAGDVRRGGLGEGCLQEAFEAACRSKVRNRGAVFVHRVKCWKRKGWEQSGGSGLAVSPRRTT